jgi:hypothetical protein
MADLLTIPLAEAVQTLKEHGITAFHMVPDAVTHKLTASHALLQPIADFFQQEATDFDTHEGIFAQIAPHSGVLQARIINMSGDA